MSLEITALTERLAPASDDAILRSLNVMQTAGMNMPAGIDPRKLLPIYQYALAGVPACGLSIATQKLIRGDYVANANVLLGTVPKPPVLAALAKGEAAATRAELARKREITAALNPALVAAERSPEVRARVRVRLAQFRAAHAATKVAAMPMQAPSSDGAFDLHDSADMAAERRVSSMRTTHDMGDGAGRRAVTKSKVEVASDAV